MEASEHEQYVTFPMTSVHETVQQNNNISRQTIRETINDCVVQDGIVNDANVEISEAHVAVEILTERSDDGEDDSTVVYPVYIKQEEQHQYASGDDESMAVEALRQLGGMYPCFDDKKVTCPNCANLFTQTEMTKHEQTCTTVKLSCTTCGEKFERKMDLNNHMVCHQVDRPHACRTCGNLFRSKANLQAHMSQVHQIEKPHKCSICSADFQRPSSLSNHLKIHTYVAGRAITQGNDSFKKWTDINITTEQIPSSSTSDPQNIQNYDVTQVQWSVPSYTFQDDQTNVTLVNDNDEKIDTLQEFTVMPNGQVTQFEYTQPNIVNSMGQQYNLGITSFDNNDTLVKIENLPYVVDNQKNYVEIDTSEATKTTHTCNQCGVSFSRSSALTVHEKTHATKVWTMPIECEYCDKQFQDANHLATHQTTCAKKLMHNSVDNGVLNGKWGKHACNECGKKFTTKQKMFRHQWIHRKKTHSCEVCGVQFEKQNQLDEHRLAAHPGDSPFTCTECGKSFVSRQGLWEHGRTHAASPAHFHCDTCSKTFSSRQGYLIHHRTHTGERPYGCKFCWKAFRDGGTLRKHERIHTGERPHVCPLCSRAFNQKVVLREHVRWVHAAGKNESQVTGPPFPCPLCGALNQDRDELCAHIVKHSDKMIAEAKAKTVNTPKAKGTKKKSTKITESSGKAGKLISDVGKTLEGHIINTKRGETLLLVTTDKNMTTQAIDDKDNDDIDKGENTSYLVPEEQETIIHAITNRNNEMSTLLIPTSKHNDNTFHFVTSNKQSSGNTLHLITKQNESLPVLAIPNPTSHQELVSESEHIIDDTEMQVLHDKDTFHSTVVQVIDYDQESDNEEDDELVCGICGDEFDNKNILMEHVKTHI